MEARFISRFQSFRPRGWSSLEAELLHFCERLQPLQRNRLRSWGQFGDLRLRVRSSDFDSGFLMKLERTKVFEPLIPSLGNIQIDEISILNQILINVWPLWHGYELPKAIHGAERSYALMINVNASPVT
jgi:hypothetical protein